MAKVHFNQNKEKNFSDVLRSRVNGYFKEKKISQKANFSMYLKSFFLIGVVAFTYTLLISGFFSGWQMIPLFALLGLFVSIETMNISHDGLHGAYVANKTGNRLFGFLMDISGASSFYWKKEHTVDHHTYTNIAEHDADLDVPFLLRLCPQTPHRAIHRFQQWYAPLLYSINLIHWFYISDFKRIYRIFAGKVSGAEKPSKWETFFLVFFKLIHIGMFLVLPLVILTNPWWQILLGYIGFLAAGSLTLTVVFQLAHIVENTAFPSPNEQGKMEDSFLIHQLATTANFATKNKLVTFLCGGLNFQVEHHLFPQICHCHLPKISEIVQSTAQEFGIPYHKNPSFFGAIYSHFRTLKKLGDPLHQ